LWNQQGSHVLRGNLVALPLGDAFLYVESIYIQATEARMPQLKKVVLAMGNRLIYRDTFEEGLADLTSGRVTLPTQQAQAAPPGPQPAVAEQRLPALTERLRRLREQANKLVEEIEAIEKESAKK